MCKGKKCGNEIFLEILGDILGIMLEREDDIVDIFRTVPIAVYRSR